MGRIHLFTGAGALLLAGECLAQRAHDSMGHPPSGAMPTALAAPLFVIVGLVAVLLVLGIIIENGLYGVLVAGSVVWGLIVARYLYKEFDAGLILSGLGAYGVVLATLAIAIGLQKAFRKMMPKRSS